MDCNEKDTAFIMGTFEAYEKKFGEWLYKAWDFSTVDWLGLAKAANTCVISNTPLTDEQRKKFFGEFDEGKVY